MLLCACEVICGIMGLVALTILGGIGGAKGKDEPDFVPNIACLVVKRSQKGSDYERDERDSLNYAPSG